MEENAQQKFLERMNELVALGKKKKSILDVQEINDFFCGHGTEVLIRWRRFLII